MSSAARNYPPATGTSGCDRQFDITMKNTRSDEELAGTNGRPIEIPNVGSTELGDDPDFDPLAAAGSDTMTRYAPTGPVPHAVSHQAQAHLAGSDVGMDIDPDLKRRSSKRKSAQAAMAMIAAQERESTTLWASSDSTGPPSSSSSNGKRRKTASARIARKQQQAPSASKKSPRGRGRGRANSSSAHEMTTSAELRASDCPTKQDEILQDLQDDFGNVKNVERTASTKQLKQFQDCKKCERAIKEHKLALLLVGPRGTRKSFTANSMLCHSEQGMYPLPSASGSKGVTRATTIARCAPKMTQFEVRYYDDKSKTTTSNVTDLSMACPPVIKVEYADGWAKALHDQLQKLRTHSDIVAISIQGPFDHGREDVVVVDMPGHEDGHPLQLEILSRRELELTAASFIIMHCTPRQTYEAEVQEVARRLLLWDSFTSVKAYVNLHDGPVSSAAVEADILEELATTLSAAFKHAGQAIMPKIRQQSLQRSHMVAAHTAKLLAMAPRLFYKDYDCKPERFSHFIRGLSNDARLDLVTRFIRLLSAFHVVMTTLNMRKHAMQLPEHLIEELREAMLQQLLDNLPDETAFTDSVGRDPSEMAKALADICFHTWRSVVDSFNDEEGFALVALEATRILDLDRVGDNLSAAIEAALSDGATHQEPANTTCDVVRQCVHEQTERLIMEVQDAVFSCLNPEQDQHDDDTSSSSSDEAHLDRELSAALAALNKSCIKARKTLKQIQAERVAATEALVDEQWRTPYANADRNSLPTSVEGVRRLKCFASAAGHQFHGVHFVEPPADAELQRICFTAEGAHSQLNCSLADRVKDMVQELRLCSGSHAEADDPNQNATADVSSSSVTQRASCAPTSLVPINVACFGKFNSLDNSGRVAGKSPPSLPLLEQYIDDKEVRRHLKQVLFLWCYDAQYDAVCDFVAKDLDVNLDQNRVFVVTLPDNTNDLDKRLLILMNTLMLELGTPRWWLMPTVIKRFCVYSPLLLYTRKATPAAALAHTEASMEIAENHLMLQVRDNRRDKQTRRKAAKAVTLACEDNEDLNDEILNSPEKYSLHEFVEQLVMLTEVDASHLDSMADVAEPVMRWLGVLGTYVPTRKNVLQFQRSSDETSSVVLARGVGKVKSPMPILVNTLAMQCTLASEACDAASGSSALGSSTKTTGRFKSPAKGGDADFSLFAFIQALVTQQVAPERLPERPVLFKDVHNGFDNTATAANGAKSNSKPKPGPRDE